MILQVSGVRLPLDAGLPGGAHLIKRCVAQAIGVEESDIDDVKMLRRSVDARKGHVGFIATMAVDCSSALDDLDALTLAKGVQVKEHVPYRPLEIPRVEWQEGDLRPVVVGTGPAGLFAAWYLAQAGIRPIVLERGGPVEDRMEAVGRFDSGAVLDPANNIQFGEGGAGTFSDGKLTTGTKSPFAQHVLHAFVDAGAPGEILWQAKPHIGTDNLVNIVKTMRQWIQDAGGDVLFYTKLDDIEFDEDGHLDAMIITASAEEGSLPAWLHAKMPRRNGSDEASCASSEPASPAFSGCRIADSKPPSADARIRIPCRQLVLACGHSARDTFRMLQRAGLLMEPKPFSIGVRIEHLQSDIDRAQYGRDAGHPALGAADYKLVVHLPDGRSVYTFCMCPGGQVVAAASEEYGVVVNGMSRYARDGENSNAALLVGVTPQDFPSNDPLAGTVFQRRIEQAAFGEAHEMGGEAWQAPAQTVGDLLAEKAGNPSKKVRPSYSRGVVWCDLREVLPPFAIDALVEAIPLLGRKLKGFDDPEAVMTGVETRSSSPVRILRDDESLQAWTGERNKKARPRDIARGHGGGPEYRNVRRDVGIYPCGEGPGYAGGIMSAATDGLRVAQKVVEDFQANHEAQEGAEPMPSALASHQSATAEQGSACAFGLQNRPTGTGSAPEDSFDSAVEALRRGEIVLFPTDTVYGVGVSVLHAHSPEAISELKERAADKPVAWLVDGIEALDLYGQDVPDYAYDLAREQWPGPLTLIVKASAAVPAGFVSRAGTVGLRVPDSDLALGLIRAVGAPLAASSANKAGQPAPAGIGQVDPAIVEGASAVLGQFAAAGEGIASTVIDCTGDQPKVIRP